MGYKINSPIKQVWLPLDYDWLFETLEEQPKFGEFAEKYKEKYGIDLHDILELNTFEQEDNTVIACSPKQSLLVGAYTVNGMYGKDYVDIRLSVADAIENLRNTTIGQQEAQPILTIAASDPMRGVGVGFIISLPADSTADIVIDDLLVSLNEQ